ncbi:hypothetical protein [Candidatus Mycoplasma haematohominis]|uniref:hypothetical protein n=1 Tax=Candidatus Mycoplasma haematohominis TaxID=1494318 RepID=UPI001C0A774C|nr:hypothetical protein [Candidatus Mycoplasma haemohominis]
MFFTTWFTATNLLKKGLGISLLLAGGGSLLHWVVISPEIEGSKAKNLPGSTPVLDSRKGNPYKWQHGDMSSAGEFSKFDGVPNIFPNLTSAYLNGNTKSRHLSELHKSLREHVSKNEDVWYVWTDKTYKNDAITQQSAARLKRDNVSMSHISAIEIPYKSHQFVRNVNSLTKSQIIQDLLWSLIEESTEGKFSVRPDSVKIDFSIEKPLFDVSNSGDQDVFPLPANKLKNFKIHFKVFNYSQNVVKVFKTIPIEPLREKEIRIQIDSAEIRPFPVSLWIGMQSAVKWGLLPTDDNQFNLSIYEIFPTLNTRHLKLPDLSIIYGRSRFISDSVASPSYSRMVNTPTYKNLKDAVDPFLIGITPKQIEEDLETWYGSLAAFHTRLRIQDVRKFLRILEMPITSGDDHKTYSVIENFVKHPHFRNNFYNLIFFNETGRKMVDKVFDTTREDSVNAKELSAMLKALAKQLETLENNMKITFTWEKKPELVVSNVEDQSPYPAVSFSFSQEFSWDQEIVIPFKGCWDDDGNNFEKDTQKDSCSGNKQYFDLSNKLDGLDEILKPIASSISPFIFGLIPSAKKFIGWEQWKIGNNEKVTNKYIAHHSPISPAITKTSDYYEQTRMAAGWKALDVKVVHDMSQFHEFVHSVYSKIDSYKDLNGVNITNFASTIAAGATLSNEKKKKEIMNDLVAFGVHLINQSFDESYFKKDQTSPENQRPWPVFFKTLLQQPFKIDSTQVFAGYSRAIFDVDEFVLKNTKEQQQQQKSGVTKNVYKISKDWQSKDVNGSKNSSIKEWDYPAKYKSESVKNIVQNYENTYSSNFPKSPMIFDFPSNEKWNLFLRQEGATSTGFMRYRDNLKNIMLEALHNKHIPGSNPPTALKHFPDQKFINWNRVKISATPIDLEKALRSVLALTNQWSTIFNAYAKVKLHSMLGEMIQRDPMLITVNMMMEDGTFRFIRDPMVFSINSVYSTYQFSVLPNLDFDKISTDLKDFIKRVGIN